MNYHEINVHRDPRVGYTWAEVSCAGKRIIIREDEWSSLMEDQLWRVGGSRPHCPTESTTSNLRFATRCFSLRWGEVTNLRGDDNRFLPAEVYRFTSCCSFLPLFDHRIRCFISIFIIRSHYKSAGVFFISKQIFNIDIALYLIVTPCNSYSTFLLFRKIVNRK